MNAEYYIGSIIKIKNKIKRIDTFYYICIDFLFKFPYVSI